MNINVVDAPCGAGKTSAAINYMNSCDNEDYRFLYITPYINEVERVVSNCKGFCQPDSKRGSKMKDIKTLLGKSKNIVSTHALFSMFDEETIDLSLANNYVLIMDEVADVVETLTITEDDKNTILEKYTTIDENNCLVWTQRDYEGKFEEYKRLCDLKCLTTYKTASGEQIVLLWCFPINVFRAFKSIYILTYMFNAQIQKYYYDYYKCTYNSIYVKKDKSGYSFTTDKIIYDLSNIKDLVSICDNQKLNELGTPDFSFSKTWYDRNKNNSIMNKIKNNTYNFFNNIVKTKSYYCLWTTFKDHEKRISGKGFSKGFLALNARATNGKRHTTSVAYLVNVFLNPYVKNFFLNYEIDVLEDEYALSEMIQFIWRSAIRDGNCISIYIPSKRMRTLLNNWINTL